MARARSGVWLGGVLATSLLLAGGVLAMQAGQRRQPEGAPEGGSRCEQVYQGLQQLEAQARGLAVAEGCSSIGRCRSAAVGAMACGGPRDYLVYCSETTDERELLGLLSRLQQSEERYNQQCGIASICVFIHEPQVALVDGVCQEAESAPLDPP